MVTIRVQVAEKDFDMSHFMAFFPDFMSIEICGGKIKDFPSESQREFGEFGQLLLTEERGL